MAQVLTFLVIVSLVGTSFQDVNDNEIDDSNPFVEAAQALFKDSKGGDVGSMIGNFIASEGGKQMGQMLLGKGGAGGSAAADIIQGIGSMMNQGGGGGGGFDFSMLGNILGMLNQESNDVRDPHAKASEGFDFSSAISLANSFLNQDGSNEFMNYLPSILEVFSSLYGAEAERKAHEHAGHSWLLPPIVEKMHIIFDTLMNSQLGRDMVKKFGAEKFIRIFSDSEGNFSYRKFVDLLENHSFRRHWIRMVTARLADGLSYVADPYTQKKYLKTAQFFVNNFLKSQGVPKAALFDPARPAQSITELVNFFPKKYLKIKMDTSAYVVPAVEYALELIQLAENKGILGRAIDSNELTHKLTDTINLEIIEPVARVNRAIRFAKKVPKCTKYVLCIANQIEDSEKLSLPGLKQGLGKGATLVGSWYISGYANIPFWTLFGLTSDGKNCQASYLEECNDFHVEEIKVTTEYVHSEL